MEAGRELDKLIAEKVMGWEEFVLESWEENGEEYEEMAWTKDKHETFFYPDDIPKFSTDIAAAWQVMNHMGNKAFQQALEDSLELYILPAKEAALVICMAALKAVGVEVE